MSSYNAPTYLVAANQGTSYNNDTDTSKMLKVPSGQIGSKWKWWYWKAHEKDINRYMFLIF